jgi:hypothetical protein
MREFLGGELAIPGGYKMRTARIKPEKHQERAYYNCVSRVVDRRVAIGEAEKEKFKKIMR